MTVSTPIRVTDFAGNGTTTIFTIGFPWQDNADIDVTLIENLTLAETPWTEGVDYTLTGGDPSGTLTATVAPASGYTIHVARVVDYLQTTDYVANDGFDAGATEALLDRIVMMIQQLADEGDGGGSSGSITLANIGTGEDVMAGLVGSQYQLKGLKVSGTGLSIASDADSITTTLAGVLLAANNLSDVASRQAALDALTAVSAATNEHVLTKDTGTGNAIWKVVPTGGGGEANTMSSAGGTHSIVLAKSGVDLPVKGFTAGANVTITPGGSDLTIAATGEANTIASDASSGLSLIPPVSKVGVQLKTKGVAIGAGMSITSSNTDVTLAINQAANLAWTGTHTFTRNVGDAPDANGAFRSLNNGAMPHLTGNTLTSLYRTVVDIQKTTSATEGVLANKQGGIHGLYVQHTITGVAGANARLFGGVRSVVDNAATGVGTEATAFYGTSANYGSNANAAWGFFSDVVHDNSNAGAVTRGFGAEVVRYDSGGVVYAYQAVNMTVGMEANAAFTAQRQANASPRFYTAFEVGNASGVSSGVDADIGFDTAYGLIGTAAFRMADGHLFRMGGLTNAGDIRHSSGDTAIQFLSGGNKTFGMEDTGIPVFYETSGTIVGGAGGASPLPATPVRYINVRYNTGTLASPSIATGKIAIFSF